MDKYKPLSFSTTPPAKSKEVPASAATGGGKRPAASSSSASSLPPSTASSSTKPITAKFSEAKPKLEAKKSVSLLRRVRNRLFDDAGGGELVVDERLALSQRRHIMRIIQVQNMAIIGLIAFFLLLVPFVQPFYEYYARNEKGASFAIMKLDAPNISNESLISWAAASMTELMTLGFGNFEQVILDQKHRFTKEGWDSFIEAVRRQKWREDFLDRQLVLTTAPSDIPVITAQGEKMGQYEWSIEIPIIMTFATNNNVKQQAKDLITLKVVRVPTKDNPSGIAIRNWKIGQESPSTR